MNQSNVVYTDERVLMEQVGLINDYELTIVSADVEYFNGTQQEAEDYAEEIAEEDGVIFVEGVPLD